MKIDLGPLTGVERGLRTRIAGGVYAGGMNGVEEILAPVVDVEMDTINEGPRPSGPSPPASPSSWFYQNRSAPKLVTVLSPPLPEPNSTPTLVKTNLNGARPPPPSPPPPTLPMT